MFDNESDICHMSVTAKFAAFGCFSYVIIGL